MTAVPSEPAPAPLVCRPLCWEEAKTSSGAKPTGLCVNIPRGPFELQADVTRSTRSFGKAQRHTAVFPSEDTEVSGPGSRQ